MQLTAHLVGPPLKLAQSEVIPRLVLIPRQESFLRPQAISGWKKSLASSPDFPQLVVTYSTEKQGKPGRISHMNDVRVERRVERTSEGDEFWTYRVVKLEFYEFVENCSNDDHGLKQNRLKLARRVQVSDG